MECFKQTVILLSVVLLFVMAPAEVGRGEQQESVSYFLEM
jgi:hypothetical protein